MRNRFLVLLSLAAISFTQVIAHADCFDSYSKDNEKYLDDKAQLSGKNLDFEKAAIKVAMVSCVVVPLAFKEPMLIAPCESIPATAAAIVWERTRELPGLVSKYEESRDVFLAYSDLQNGKTERFKNAYQQLHLTDTAAQNAFNERFMEAMDTGKFCEKGKKMNIKEAIAVANGQAADLTN